MAGRPMETRTDAERRKLTYEDFLLFPEDGKRHELIDGEHFVTPSPVTRHQAILQNLYLLLAPRVREEGLGQLFIAPLDVILSNIDVVEPDLLFVRSGREEIIDDWVRGAPDLVVEVLSPSTRGRDETLKRDLYERFGVSEYWLVDPEAETVKIYRLAQGAYGRPALLLATQDDAIETPLVPGLEVPLARVFES